MICQCENATTVDDGQVAVVPIDLGRYFLWDTIPKVSDGVFGFN